MGRFWDNPIPQQGAGQRLRGGVMLYFLLSVVVALILTALLD